VCAIAGSIGFGTRVRGVPHKTARQNELGYHVTLVRDATAAFKPEMMHAAHELNGPTFAHAILTRDELIASLNP
jgi:nicotinamidase-related amidase